MSIPGYQLVIGAQYISQIGEKNRPSEVSLQAPTSHGLATSFLTGILWYNILQEIHGKSTAAWKRLY